MRTANPELCQKLVAETMQPALWPARITDMIVLYASGYTGDLVERYGISGSAPFIEKPFSFDSLARKVKELLELGKLQKSAA